MTSHIEIGMRHVGDNLRRAAVIDITAVAAYFVSQKGDGKVWRLSDFPNIAPPFPALWMEYSNPYPGPDVRSVGLLFVADDVELSGNAYSVPARVLDPNAVTVTGERHYWGHDFSDAVQIGAQDGLKWVVDAFLWTEAGSRILGPHIQSRYFLQPDGGNFLRGGWAVTWLLRQEDPAEGTDTGVLLARNGLYPGCLAISFMHCKNVALTAVDPPPKLNKARVKRGKKPLVRYHVLEIEPMKEVLRREGQIEKTGLRQALHICRGHFACYGDEYGKGKLFGRHSGQFFIPMHARGSIKEGAVVKDYQVNAPRRGTGSGEVTS